MLETDCPYMAPEPYRGKRNQSSYIRYVAEKIAELKEMSQEEVIAVTEKKMREICTASKTQAMNNQENNR